MISFVVYNDRGESKKQRFANSQVMMDAYEESLENDGDFLDDDLVVEDVVIDGNSVDDCHTVSDVLEFLGV